MFNIALTMLIWVEDGEKFETGEFVVAHLEGAKSLQQVTETLTAIAGTQQVGDQIFHQNIEVMIRWLFWTSATVHVRRKHLTRQKAMLIIQK